MPITSILVTWSVLVNQYKYIILCYTSVPTDLRVKEGVSLSSSVPNGEDGHGTETSCDKTNAGPDNAFVA